MIYFKNQGTIRRINLVYVTVPQIKEGKKNKENWIILYKDKKAKTVSITNRKHKRMTIKRSR